MQGLAQRPNEFGPTTAPHGSSRPNEFGLLALCRLERRLEIERAFVERAAGDRTGDAFALVAGEFLDVLQAVDAAVEIALDGVEVADSAAKLHGISSPITLTTSRIASSFLGFPANAPLRSTMCRRCAPSSSQCCAIAAGSSENTVADCISPCLRRTQ